LKPSCDVPLLSSTSAFSPWRQTSRKQRSAILDVPLPERPLRTVHAALPARNFSFRLSRLWALKSSWTEVQLLHRVSDKSGMLPQVPLWVESGRSRWPVGRKSFVADGSKAEICSAIRHVRFGPKADIHRMAEQSLIKDTEWSPNLFPDKNTHSFATIDWAFVRLRSYRQRVAF